MTTSFPVSLLSVADPVITSFTPPESPREGNELRITCIVGGTPVPDVTWTKNGEAVPDSLIVSSSGRVNNEVRIPSASTEDSGIYRCIASNLAGSTFMESPVEVSGMDYNISASIHTRKNSFLHT